MSLEKAEAEFIRVCNEISELENRLSTARQRAEKLAHYIEIAREHESAIERASPRKRGRGAQRKERQAKVVPFLGKPGTPADPVD